MQRRSPRGFSLIELLIFILLLGILLPALGAARRTARQMANSTQLRGIHQSMVVYAQSNKKGGNDGFFPGLDSSGNLTEADPAGRLSMMLYANHFTPEYIISPADTERWEISAADYANEVPLTWENHSYAMLPIADADADAGRRAEWKETLNTSAIVLSDRNTGRPDALSSVWTEQNSGDWRGTISRNDNSTSFEVTAAFEHTKYGSYAANEWDELFSNETPAGSDALMVHRIDGGLAAAQTP